MTVCVSPPVSRNDHHKVYANLSFKIKPKNPKNIMDKSPEPRAGPSTEPPAVPENKFMDKAPEPRPGPSTETQVTSKPVKQKSITDFFIKEERP